jgi:hypothetical protein
LLKGAAQPNCARYHNKDIDDPASQLRQQDDVGLAAEDIEAIEG